MRSLLPSTLAVLLSLSLPGWTAASETADYRTWSGEFLQRTLSEEMLAPAFEPIDAGPAPQPAWFTAEISDLTPNGPGARAGLQPGDRILGIDGWRCYGMQELQLLWQARLPGDDAIEIQVLRDASVFSLEVTGLLPENRLGVGLRHQPAFKFGLNADIPITAKSAIGWLAASQGLTVSSELDIFLQTLSDRRAWELAQAIQTSGSPAWLSDWLRWYDHLIRRQMPEADGIYREKLNSIDIAGWMRMTQFMHDVTHAEGPAHTDLAGLGVSAAYYVLHYPQPHVPLSFGAPEIRSPKLLQLLQNLYQEDAAGLAARQRLMWANDLVESTRSSADNYLTRLAWAMADYDSHGGWPLRHQSIYRSKSRRTLIKDLQQLRDQGRGEPLLVSIGLLMAHGLEKNLEAAGEELQRLQRQSPFVAAWAGGRLAGGLRYHSQERLASEWNKEYMAPLVEGRVVGADFFQLLAQRQALLKGNGLPTLDRLRSEPPIPSDCLYKATRALLPMDMWFGPVIDSHFALVRPINNLVWQLAVNPALDDAEQLARQLGLLVWLMGRDLQPGERDTVAAAFARLGDFEAATRWQLSALSTGAGIIDTTSFHSRLQLYRQSQVYQEPAPEAAPAVQDRAFTGTGGEYHFSGMFHRGSRYGEWRISREQTPVASGSFSSGRRNGLWQHYDDAGVLRQQGLCLHTRSQQLQPVGLWQYFHADGSLAASGGWGLGGKPLGPWSVYAPDGSLVATRLFAADDRPPQNEAYRARTAEWQLRAPIETLPAISLGLPPLPIPDLPAFAFPGAVSFTAPHLGLPCLDSTAPPGSPQVRDPTTTGVSDGF